MCNFFGAVPGLSVSLGRLIAFTSFKISVQFQISPAQRGSFKRIRSAASCFIAVIVCIVLPTAHMFP